MSLLLSIVIVMLLFALFLNRDNVSSASRPKKAELKSHDVKPRDLVQKPRQKLAVSNEWEDEILRLVEAIFTKVESGHVVHEATRLVCMQVGSLQLVLTRLMMQEEPRSLRQRTESDLATRGTVQQLEKIERWLRDVLHDVETDMAAARVKADEVVRKHAAAQRAQMSVGQPTEQ